MHIVLSPNQWYCENHSVDIHSSGTPWSVWVGRPKSHLVWWVTALYDIFAMLSNFSYYKVRKIPWSHHFSHVTKKNNIRTYNKQSVSHLAQVCQEDSIRHRWVFVNANINPSQFIIVDFYAHRFDAVHVNFVLHETAMGYVRAHVYKKTSTEWIDDPASQRGLLTERMRSPDLAVCCPTRYRWTRGVPSEVVFLVSAQYHFTTVPNRWQTISTCHIFGVTGISQVPGGKSWMCYLA